MSIKRYTQIQVEMFSLLIVLSKELVNLNQTKRMRKKFLQTNNYRLKIHSQLKMELLSLSLQCRYSANKQKDFKEQHKLNLMLYVHLGFKMFVEQYYQQMNLSLSIKPKKSMMMMKSDLQLCTHQSQMIFTIQNLRSHLKHLQSNNLILYTVMYQYLRSSYSIIQSSNFEIKLHSELRLFKLLRMRSKEVKEAHSQIILN